VDWERVGIDDVVAQLEATYAEFMTEIWELGEGG
jgi:hypothetical protein